MLLGSEEELEEDLDEDLDEDEELDEADDERLERELLELDEDDDLFVRPGTKISLSFIRTFLSSITSSSSLMLITLMIFSAAFSPT